MDLRSINRRDWGLTRLEVVVVLGVLGILAVILLGIVPALRQARAFAKQINCVNNLKTWAFRSGFSPPTTEISGLGRFPKTKAARWNSRPSRKVHGGIS